MEIVRLKDKGQVTIPAAIREELNAQLGDFFSIAVQEGVIILKPQSIMSRNQETASPKKQVSPSSWFGSVKGVYSSVEEVDAFIKAERSQWD